MNTPQNPVTYRSISINYLEKIETLLSDAIFPNIQWKGDALQARDDGEKERLRLIGKAHQMLIDIDEMSEKEAAEKHGVEL